jgi:hypothetical protein
LAPAWWFFLTSEPDRRYGWLKLRAEAAWN